MSQIIPQVRGLYAILKRNGIENFTKFKKDVFESILISYGLEGLWRGISGREWQNQLIQHPFSYSRGVFDGSFMTLLSKIYEQPWFLKFLDDIIDELISINQIENFNYDGLKQLIIHCGFEETQIEAMKLWKNEGNVKVDEEIITKDDSGSLGTLNHLENSLINKIYEEIIVNPTRYHKKSRDITTQRKKAVKIRDDFICQICNEKFEEDELVVDHIFPYGAGGSNEEYNLMVLCEECNGNKSARLDYYRGEEGKLKIMENIKRFVKTIPMIHDFGDWLEKIGDKRRRK